MHSRRRFAILLPLTSRGSTLEKFTAGLQSLADRLKDTSKISDVVTYFGVDDDDIVLREGMASNMWKQNDLQVGTTLFFQPSSPPKICHFWRDLAQEAYKDGMDFFILLGDDVTVHSSDWTQRVERAFEDLHREIPSVDFGFGCIALNDVGAPGFPTFPVLHRLHMDIFGEMIPDVFINQDGDPFLFQLYKRWGASRFLQDVTLENGVGGMQLMDDPSYQAPRYERRWIDWKHGLLQDHVKMLEDWMKSHLQTLPVKKVVIDVVTPSYRVNPTYLKGIVSIPVPSICECMFIVIVDNPSADIAWLRDLEKEMGGRLRVRKHMTNMGASQSRNSGMAESAADWILMLDDDVIPSRQILNAYAEAILKFGDETDGFVGCTVLPVDHRLASTGIHLAGITYFWDIAR